MGKNWRGDRGSRGGRGGGPMANGLQSCRGHAIIIGTCDVVRERESNKELLSLLNEAVDQLQEQGELAKPDAEEEDEDEGEGLEGNMADMLAAEIKQVKEKKGLTQDFFCVNSGIKGVILIKFMRKDVCPVRLLKMIFDRVRDEKQSYSRHLCRLVPCSNCFYPNGKEIVQNIRELMSRECEDLERELPDVVYPPEAEKSNKEKKREKRREEERLAREAEKAEKARKVGEDAEDAEAGTKRPAAESEEGEKSDGEPEQKQRKVEEQEEKEEDDEENGATTAPTHTSEPVEPVVVPPKVWEGESKFQPISFDLAIKSRSHNVLTKAVIKEFAISNLPAPPKVSYLYKNPEVSVCVLCVTDLHQSHSYFSLLLITYNI